MPAYKDSAGKWYCKFYYQDADRNRRQKFKRGFTLKREADAWERDFIQRASVPPAAAVLALPWSEYIDTYLADSTPSMAAHSAQTIRYRIKNHIRPAFDCRLQDVTPAMLQAWANALTETYSLKHCRNLYGQMRTIFNHAARLYGLTPNPCDRVTPPRKRENKKEMQFWTLDEYRAAIACVDDLKARTAITLLYWSGLRKGELLALTWGDLAEGGTLTVNKSLQRLGGESVITPPKTASSVRTILLPSQALDALSAWQAACSDTSAGAPVFQWEKQFIEKGLAEGCKAAEVKRIRVHDLRHSHASYLISRGANIKLVSVRLGHAKTSMTLDTYGHLYPSDERQIIDLMDAENG